MPFNQDPRIRFFLFCIVFVIASLSYLIKVLSEHFLYKYLDSFKSKFTINVLVGLHWTISVASAFILPDYLAKYDFFKHIFENSELWICLTMLCLFFISLIVLGVILNLAFCRQIIKGNLDKNENH